MLYVLNKNHNDSNFLLCVQRVWFDSTYCKQYKIIRLDNRKQSIQHISQRVSDTMIHTHTHTYICSKRTSIRI